MYWCLRKVLRKPRKRGGKATKRRISNEQCCILVAVQRNGNAYAKHIGFGKPLSDEIKTALADIVVSNSALITDGDPSYNKLSKDKALSHLTVFAHKEYTSLIHINTVNSLHNKFQSMITKYHGVATHYMNHYCALLTLIRKYQDMDNMEMLSATIKNLKTQKFDWRLKQCIS